MKHFPQNPFFKQKRCSTADDSIFIDFIVRKQNEIDFILRKQNEIDFIESHFLFIQVFMLMDISHLTAVFFVKFLAIKKKIPVC